MRLFAAALGVLLAAAVAAEARQHYPARGHRILPGGALLDGGGSFTTSVSGAYGLRKLESAYSGPAMRLRRASDNAELDIGFLGFVPGLGAPPDIAAANSFCNATTCFAANWYDQSGLGRHMPQPAAASQLQYIANCQNFLPCLRISGAQNMNSGAVTPATGIVSISAVGSRISGTATCAFRQNGGDNRLEAINGTANQWWLASSGAAFSPTSMTDGVFHAFSGSIAGAASVLNSDGTETTATVTGSTVTGGHQLVGASCNFAEFVIWDNYQLTAGERAVLRNNQKAFWGTP